MPRDSRRPSSASLSIDLSDDDSNNPKRSNLDRTNISHTNMLEQSPSQPDNLVPNVDPQLNQKKKRRRRRVIEEDPQ